MNFFEQIAGKVKQMASPAAGVRIAHVMLRTDEEALNYRTRGECYELLSVWKERIDGDPEKFDICARERSECASRDRGGDLGFVTPLLYGMNSKVFRDVTEGDNRCSSACCGDYGFAAAAGWDPVTGLGSVDADE